MNSRILKRAIDIAKALHPTVQSMRSCHISFLVLKSKIIKIGFNKDRTHPINSKFDYRSIDGGIHAELDLCLKMRQDDLSKYSMVVIRHDNNMNLTLSRPCIGCQSVLKQFGITDVYYSTKDGIEQL